VRNTAEEQDTIRRFVEWGEARPSVRAMILTSSRAVPNAPVDVFTDYDLILVLTDVLPYFEDRGWLGDFGPVLVVHRDPLKDENGAAQAGYITQYENGLKIDFTLWHIERLRTIAAASDLPDEFDAGYRVILDKDGLTADLKPPTYKAFIPKPPSQAEYDAMIESFFLDCIYTAKYLWRDDVMAAKHLLDYYIKQDYLRPMLEWRSEIDHGWSVKPGPFGRRLKQWLRPDLWEALANTYAGAELDENWQALFRTVELFRRVAVEVGGYLGYAYPHDLERRVIAYIHKVKQLERDADTFPD
jgi:aminoglycoside 6-adenylyltransferase